MANLKYKDNNGNWQTLNTVRGPKGDNADITLNGQTHINASFYAPEQSGTIGQFLTSYGSGNSPVWVNLSRVAATGNYDDLNGKPIIPTTTSDIISGSTAAFTSGGAFTALAQRGIPSGGSAGQILIKSSGTDYAVEWGSVIEVENSLMSTSTTNALSAAQGKILNTNKQDKLVSGTNIKTVNGNSLLGNGDIQIAGGGNVDDVKVNGTSVVTNKVANINLEPIEQSISTINGKIPTQASSTNKLADKAFVNSSVQTATANFRGNWDNWSSVPTESNLYPSDYIGSTTPTINDYLVVKDASDYDSIPIPDAYQKIDYIETSGTQYLDTGITPNQNTVIEMTFETDSMNNNDSFIFGCGYGGGNRAFELYPWNGMFEVNYGASTPFTTTALQNTLYSVKLGMGLFYINNILSYTFPEQTFEAPFTLTLAALNRSSVYIAPNHIKIYKFKSYDNGTLTRNMIPCYRLSDNKKGMYDAVTETFFENAGTGDFIQGPISGETESREHSGTWRFKYSGLWDEDGKSGWRPEYQVNEMPLTAAQLAALNSGATEESINAIGNKQDRLISGTNIKTINNQSLLGNGDITVDNLPINSIIEYDGDTIPEGYEIYTDYTTTVQKTLFETTSWGSMMQRFETKSIDFSSYDYVEVEFTGQGGTNTTNTILKIDLHQPVKTTMTNDGISYKYGASICFPDIQLLQGANNDPGIFRIGACISTAKDRIWMGDPGYFTGQTNSGNFDTNSTYNRISKIVGFKFVQKLKKTFQGTLLDNKIVNTYSESQTDTYSCDYINKNTSYSTSETNTRKTWIDGKPIYRKVISTTVTLEYGTDTDIAHGISNLDQVIDIKMLSVPNANGVQYIFPYLVENKASFTNPVFVSRTNITVRTYQDSWSSGVKIFVLEYTKTTD